MYFSNLCIFFCSFTTQFYKMYLLLVWIVLSVMFLIDWRMILIFDNLINYPWQHCHEHGFIFIDWLFVGWNKLEFIYIRLIVCLFIFFTSLHQHKLIRHYIRFPRILSMNLFVYTLMNIQNDYTLLMMVKGLPPLIFFFILQCVVVFFSLLSSQKL